jgi:hypothetical protein
MDINSEGSSRHRGHRLRKLGETFPVPSAWLGLPILPLGALQRGTPMQTLPPHPEEVESSPAQVPRLTPSPSSPFPPQNCSLKAPHQSSQVSGVTRLQ